MKVSPLHSGSILVESTQVYPRVQLSIQAPAGDRWLRASSCQVSLTGQPSNIQDGNHPKVPSWCALRYAHCPPHMCTRHPWDCCLDLLL